MAEQPGVLFTEEQRKKVLDAINAKMGEVIRTCPICGTSNWGIQGNGLVYLQLVPPGTQGLVIGGVSLPNVVVMCQHCGNTVMLNVFVLGVADLFGLKAGPPPETPPTPTEQPAEAKQ